MLVQSIASQMSKARPHDWYKREKKHTAAKKTFKFSRKEWKFLEKTQGVEASLDAYFGPERRHKVRFTEQIYLTR